MNIRTSFSDYIIDSGTYNTSAEYYSVTLGVTYSSDYTSKYTRMAFYYPNSNTITLDYHINGGDYWVYFTIEDTVDGSYSWSYFDDSDNNMRGTLYAATYTSNSLLGYSYNNISSSSLRASVRELASIMISNLCTWIDTDFNSINVTAEDLGFAYY